MLWICEEFLHGSEKTLSLQFLEMLKIGQNDEFDDKYLRKQINRKLQKLCKFIVIYKAFISN